MSQNQAISENIELQKKLHGINSNLDTDYGMCYFIDNTKKTKILNNYKETSQGMFEILVSFSLGFLLMF